MCQNGIYQKLQTLVGFFYNCFNLEDIPDVSKWDISNVNDISYLFYGCKSAKKLPNILKWDI